MNTALHRIVVVGGGAGGMELATHLGLKLGRRRIARTILVDGNPTHIWKPLLHEVATGALNTGEDEVNYFVHAHRSHFEFEFGWMNGLDRNRRVINLDKITGDDGQLLVDSREVRYDSLVLAVGAVTNHFNTPGVDKYCLFLNTPADAEKLRRRILGQALSVVTRKFPKLRVGIVGGGATGVELAAEIYHTICELRHCGSNLLTEQLQMTLMEGSGRLLSSAPESLSKYAFEELTKRNINIRTDCWIKAVNEEGFVLNDNTTVPAEIKIWTAGIKAPDWLKGLNLSVNKLNQIKVNANLQSIDDEHIFAIGDCAYAPDRNTENFLSPTAAVAHQQAEWLTQKLSARLENKTCPPFIYNPRGMLVSLGEGGAVGRLAALVGPKKNYYVEGLPAKLLYASLYRMHQAVLYGWFRAGILWAGDKLRKVALPQLKLH